MKCKNVLYVSSLVLFACLNSILAFASDGLKSQEDKENKNKIIAGIYGGISFMETSSNYYAGITEIDMDFENKLVGGSYGIKAGYDLYFLPKHSVRMYVDYMNSYFNSNDRIIGSLIMHTIGLNADYKFDIFDNFGVFAGVGGVLNIINMQYLANKITFGGSINAGVSYIVSFVEFEFRMRYLAYSLPDINSNHLPVISSVQTTSHKVSIDSPLSFHFGVNFRF